MNRKFLDAPRGNPYVSRLPVSEALAAIRMIATTSMVLLLAMGDPAPVHAANRDYYNPGTGTDEKADWENAHKFHLQPAFDAMKRGAWGVAQENLEFILIHFPNSPQALNGISELCEVKWRSPKCDADSWFDKAVAVNPAIATTWVIYGIHLQRERRPSEAIERFQRALTLRPDDLNAHYNLGLAYFELKEYDKANEQAQISYALGASLPGLRNKLIRVGMWKPLPPTSSDTGDASGTGSAASKPN